MKKYLLALMAIVCLAIINAQEVKAYSSTSLNYQWLDYKGSKMSWQIPEDVAGTPRVDWTTYNLQGSIFRTGECWMMYGGSNEFVCDDLGENIYFRDDISYNSMGQSYYACLFTLTVEGNEYEYPLLVITRTLGPCSWVLESARFAPVLIVGPVPEEESGQFPMLIPVLYDGCGMSLFQDEVYIYLRYRRSENDDIREICFKYLITDSSQIQEAELDSEGALLAKASNGY